MKTFVSLPRSCRQWFPALMLLTSHAGATLLTFVTDPPLPGTPPMPQDYGDAVSAESMLSSDGNYNYLHEQGIGWTPGITIEYRTSRPQETPSYTYETAADWPGACQLWSSSFRSGQAIGDPAIEPEKMMPSGFEYYFILHPSANKAPLLRSFVLDDREGYFDSVAHTVEWRVTRGTPDGEVLASGTETLSGGENRLVNTGLDLPDALRAPMVLVVRRISGIEDDLAIDDLEFEEAGFETLSYNSGSLGGSADGVNTPDVVLDQAGALTAGADFSSSYSNGARTTLPWRAELNPPASSPFTIEFWARPQSTDNDDCPVFNRVTDGDRSGWIFFQRDAGTGWNFRMYNGTGGNLAWDLTGGTAELDSWSHVVAVWSGTNARLYVNGTLASATNASGVSGTYRASDMANFAIGSYDNGNTAMNGRVDEVAFYPSALPAARVLAHYNAATSGAPGTYPAAVLADNPLLYYQQNPPAVVLSGFPLNPVVTFQGTLSSSADLSIWQNQDVTSPWPVPTPLAGRLFFRTSR